MFSYFIKLTSLHQADDTSNTDDDAKSTISAGNQSSWCELNRKYLAVAHYVAAWQRDQHRAVLHILIIFWASVSVSSQSYSSLNSVMLTVSVSAQNSVVPRFPKLELYKVVEILIKSYLITLALYSNPTLYWITVLTFYRICNNLLF